MIATTLDKLEEDITETLIEEKTNITFSQKEELKWIRHQARSLRDKINEDIYC